MGPDGLHLKGSGGANLAQTLAIHQLLADYIDRKLTRLELLDAIEAVKRFGVDQPGLFTTE